MTAHYDEQSYTAELASFMAEHPGYDASSIDDLRSRDYGRLDRLGHVYLDYTGGGLWIT